MMRPEFVTTAKGVERHHNVLHLTDPVNRGGTGLHQIYWAFWCRYISLMQTVLRNRDSKVRIIAQRPVDRKMAPIRDYLTMLRQLGAWTSIRLHDHQAPRGAPISSMRNLPMTDCTCVASNRGFPRKLRYVCGGGATARRHSVAGPPPPSECTPALSLLFLAVDVLLRGSFDF